MAIFEYVNSYRIFAEDNLDKTTNVEDTIVESKIIESEIIEEAKPEINNKYPTKKFSIYKLSEGKPGKEYTIKDFLKIYSESKKKPSRSNTKKAIELEDGYIYSADSQQEISILKKLISNKAFKRLRGQAPGIRYKYAGKQHYYYPDFFFITQTNKIVIMEAKEIAQMNSKENLKKYEALKRYCEKNGFLYIMCDKSLTTFESLKEKKSNSYLNQTIDSALNEKGRFDYHDYQNYIEGKDRKRIKYIRKGVGVYVTSHPGTKMIGDLNYKCAQFRIIKKK